MVHKGKCSVKSRLHIIRIFKSEQIFYCRPFFLLFPYPYPSKKCYRTSYHIITFRRSLRYLICLQTPYPNYPVIPQGPKHSYLLPDFIVILSFRSVCQLCGWSVPTSGPRYRWCFSDVLRHQSEVLYVLWTVVMLSSPRYYTCRWINVSPSGPKY